ncbi:hypothetical protein [Persephonella sp.]|uniref:hypothetical protein n=1 Tax=Persephonella sp. TaxID=2060922 RepID=UPI00261F93C0|nr:hypothetical protein [Persephonella sp.]
MNIYNEEYIKDYIDNQLRNFYEKTGRKHLEDFLEINIIRKKGFRVSVKFIDGKGEIKYIEQFLPDFELQRVVHTEVVIKNFMDSVVLYIIREYEGKFKIEPVNLENTPSDILKFLIK